MTTAAGPSPLRRALNALYDAAAALAGVFMVLLLAMVMASILGRQLHFNLPGVDAYAGYMMAATGFLALAHTLKKGEHIRVTLLTSSLTGAAKRGFEIWALFAASALAALSELSALSALSAVYSTRLAWQAYTFHDISTSSDATPLWLPQLSMALGTTVLAVAFIDELVLELRGERVAVETEEALRNE